MGGRDTGRYLRKNQQDSVTGRGVNEVTSDFELGRLGMR